MARADIDELKIVIEADDKASDVLKKVLTQLEDLGNVQIDTDAFETIAKEAEKTSTQLEDIAKKFSMMDAVNLKRSFDEISLKNKQLYQAYEKLQRLMNDPNAKPEQITSQVSKIFSLQKQIAKAKEEQEKLNKTFDVAVTKAEAIDFSKSITTLDLLKRKLDEAYSKLHQLMRSSSTPPEQITSQLSTIQSLERQIAKASMTSAEWNKNIAVNEERLARQTASAKKLSGAFNSLGKSIGKTAGRMALFPFTQLASGANKASKAVSKLFTKLKTVAMYRALRGFIKMINEGFKEGTQNAYQWSKALSSPLENGRYAQNLDSLATSALYLKNAFGAVAIPIINAFTNTLNKMADMVVEVLNIINRFVATITGAGSWTKALRYPKEFAENLQTATGRAKELKDAITILGIDEINPLNAVNEPSGGGGAGADALDYSKMFEEVEITAENTFSELFDPLLNAWEKKGGALIASMEFAFGSVKTLISDIGESFKEVWTNGTGQETIEHILSIFTNINTMIGNIAEGISEAWNTDGLGTEILQNHFDQINGILETWEKITKATSEWAKDLDFTPILESIKDLTQGFEDLLEPIEDGLVWAWENVLLPLGKWGIEVGLPETLGSLGKALGSIGSILKSIGESKAGEVLGAILEKAVELYTRLAGNGFLTPLKDFAEVLSDIAKILNGETTLKDAFAKWIEEMGLRISVQGYYLQKAWEALKNLDLDAMSDALMDFVDVTHSEVYVNMKARVDGIEDARKEKDKKLEFLATIREGEEPQLPTGGTAFGVINGVRYANAGGGLPVSLGKVTFDQMPEIDATANFVRANDDIPMARKVVNNMTAELAKKNETFGKTTGAMTANLSKKAETFSVVTGAMTALLGKKNETFTKTTSTMTALLGKKSETFTKTTGAMTANLSKKSESFNPTTGKMTANLSQKNETFAKWTYLEGWINKLFEAKSISGDKWLYLQGWINKLFESDVIDKDKWLYLTGWINSLQKTANAKIDLSGTLVTSKTGRETNVAVSLKKRGGVFSHGFWKNIPQYAGGTLNAGSMFIAGEAGAELVGNVGGRTEVLNQSQIAQAMASSMMQANAGQNALLAEQNSLLRQLLEKDSTVTAILSTSSLADGVARKNRREGRTVIPVGV